MKNNTITVKESIEELEDIKLHLTKFENMVLHPYLRGFIKNLRQRTNVLDKELRELQSAR